MKYINFKLNMVGQKLGGVEIAKFSQGGSNEFDVMYVDASVNLKLNRALWIKDKINMSNEQYRLFRKELNVNSPSIKRLVKYQHELNRSLNIKRISTGYYMDSMDLIKAKIEHLIRQHIIKPGNAIYPKLSQDGTQLSRNTKIVNFVINIINEGKKAAEGCYPIGVFKIDDENYDTVATWVSNVWKRLKVFDKFQLDNNIYNILYFFSADYKMLIFILGLYSATSNFPCIFCTQHTDKLKEVGEPRTFDENRVYSTDPKKHRGYKNPPLIKDIPFIRYIICLLHCMLRVTDKLFELLIPSVIRLDNFKSKFDPTKHIYLEKLRQFLKNDINVTIGPIDLEVSSILQKLQSLQGPKKIKIFERLTQRNCNLHTFFDGKLKNSEKVSQLWIDYWSINTSLSSDSKLTGEHLKITTKLWMDDFTQIYQEKHITPYIHCMTHHLHESWTLFGNIGFFSGQGIEKLNDMSTIRFFKSTNKKSDLLNKTPLDTSVTNIDKNDFSYQLLAKMGRSMILNKILKKT